MSRRHWPDAGGGCGLFCFDAAVWRGEGGPPCVAPGVSQASPPRPGATCLQWEELQLGFVPPPSRVRQFWHRGIHPNSQDLRKARTSPFSLLKVPVMLSHFKIGDLTWYLHLKLGCLSAKSSLTSSLHTLEKGLFQQGLGTSWALSPNSEYCVSMSRLENTTAQPQPALPSCISSGARLGHCHTVLCTLCSV